MVIVGAVAVGGGVDGVDVLLLSLPQPTRATQRRPAHTTGKLRFRRRSPVIMSMAVRCEDSITSINLSRSERKWPDVKRA